MDVKDWRLHLHPGDEIVVDTGDNELPPSIIIGSIEYLTENAVRIVTKEGERIDCLLKEIL